VPQTEEEYIRLLRNHLSGRLNKEQVEDIVSDYSEHFRIGKSVGRSEEDLYQALGSPHDVARELNAIYLVHKAEQSRSCGNIWHAIVATLGLGLFNIVFVIVPFILLLVVLALIFLAGGALSLFGPFTFVLAVLQLAGTPWLPLWLSPAAGIFLSIGMTTLGLLLIIGDYYLARFFYHLVIRYLKWNISVIKGTEEAT
jgi:uncharacterized membrane protein